MPLGAAYYKIGLWWSKVKLMWGRKEVYHRCSVVGCKYQ